MPAQQIIPNYAQHAANQANLMQGAFDTAGKAIGDTVNAWQESKKKAGHVERVYSDMAESLKTNLDKGAINDNQFMQIIQKITPTDTDKENPEAYGHRVANAAAIIDYWDKSGARAKGAPMPDITTPYSAAIPAITESMKTLEETGKNALAQQALSGSPADALPPDQAGPVRPGVPAATSKSQFVQNYTNLGGNILDANRVDANAFPPQKEPLSLKEQIDLDIANEKLKQERLETLKKQKETSNPTVKPRPPEQYTEMSNASTNLQSQFNVPINSEAANTLSVTNQQKRSNDIISGKPGEADIMKEATRLMRQDPTLTKDKALIASQEKYAFNTTLTNLMNSSDKIVSSGSQLPIVRGLVNIDSPEVQTAIKLGMKQGFSADSIIQAFLKVK